MTNFFSLMQDPFGNYLTQKIVENSEGDQLREIVTRVEEGPLELCKSMHGTRSIQKIVEYLKDSPHKVILSK